MFGMFIRFFLSFFPFFFFYQFSTDTFYIKQIPATTKSRRSDGRGIFQVLITNFISYSFTPFLFLVPLFSDKDSKIKRR